MIDFKTKLFSNQKKVVSLHFNLHFSLHFQPSDTSASELFIFGLICN